MIDFPNKGELREPIAKLIQIALNLYVVPSPGLEIDGIIGPKTVEAMKQAIAQTIKR